MVTGHPDLIRAIVDEIQARGPISFARFMELSLYHPLFGYYVRFADKADAEVPDAEHMGEDRIGWSGDYYTSSDVSPVFAHSLAKQIDQMDALLGRPDPLTVIEMGAGKGILARDVLTACQDDISALYERLRYVIIERSPMMQASQQRYLAPWRGDSGRVTWLNSLTELGTESVVGVYLSNELVDAFPVHRIRVADGALQEVFVDYRGGRFCERVEPVSTPKLADHLRRLATMGIVLSDGACADINLQAMEWMREVASGLQRGFVITIDYGHTAHDLFSLDRCRGTLLCYYHQMTSEDPYQRIGLQDMTAHVDFTALVDAGEAAGLQVTGFTNQLSFLTGLGVERALEGLEPGSAAFQSIVQLMRPGGMGQTFKILIQHKGMETPALDGLRFKPFLGTALTARRSPVTPH